MKTQQECIHEINEWCKNFIQESGISSIRTNIHLCTDNGRIGFRIFVNFSGITAEHPRIWYDSRELGKENNLVGRELISRWDEIKANLIYQADIKALQRQTVDTFNVGSAYSGQKDISPTEVSEKYVLIFSDGESIDATTYNSKEEAYANMKNAYEESYPEGQEEDWADMSYLGDDSALLYLNGDGVCCWDIHTVQFTDAQRIHPAIQDEVSEMQKYTKSMLKKAREEC